MESLGCFGCLLHLTDCFSMNLACLVADVVYFFSWGKQSVFRLNFEEEMEAPPTLPCMSISHCYGPLLVIDLALQIQRLVSLDAFAVYRSGLWLEDVHSPFLDWSQWVHPLSLPSFKDYCAMPACSLKGPSCVLQSEKMSTAHLLIPQQAQSEQVTLPEEGTQ